MLKRFLIFALIAGAAQAQQKDDGCAMPRDTTTDRPSLSQGAVAGEMVATVVRTIATIVPQPLHLDSAR